MSNAQASRGHIWVASGLGWYWWVSLTGAGGRAGWGVVGEESAGHREVGTGQGLRESQGGSEPVPSCLS